MIKIYKNQSNTQGSKKKNGKSINQQNNNLTLLMDGQDPIVNDRPMYI